MDESAWENAATFKDFPQTDPGDNIAPSKPTESCLMYDEKNLYIALRCWDEKDGLRSTVAKRDEIFNADNVRVYLDTYWGSTPCIFIGLESAWNSGRRDFNRG